MSDLIHFKGISFHNERKDNLKPIKEWLIYSHQLSEWVEEPLEEVVICIPSNCSMADKSSRNPSTLQVSSSVTSLGLPGSEVVPRRKALGSSKFVSTRRSFWVANIQFAAFTDTCDM